MEGRKNEGRISTLGRVVEMSESLARQLMLLVQDIFISPNANPRRQTRIAFLR